MKDAAKDAGLTRIVLDVVVRPLTDGSPGARIGVLVVSLSEQEYADLLAEQDAEERRRAAGN